VLTCLVYERQCEWAAAIRRQWTVYADESAKIVELREWEGVGQALRQSPRSLVCFATGTMRLARWLSLWPTLQSDFPLARAVALASREDRMEESAWRDAGVIEVIRGRGDLACLMTLLARQQSRYPAPTLSWQSAIRQRLPWDSGNDD
jgi:hypothetical protein